MGQINLPLLNRTGYSVFWDSCFENKFNFSRDLYISLFAKKILKLFFKDKESKIFFFLKKKQIKAIFLNDLKKSNNFNAQNQFLKVNNFFSLTKQQINISNKGVPFYGTKIFFIKFNN